MLTTLAVLLSLTGGAPAVELAAAGSNEVDVELVLAVDMSGSMDFEEAEIQRAGYVEAIRHPDFIKAVQSGLTGRVALTYFEWAGKVNEGSLVPWTIIESANDAQSFAAALEDNQVSTRRGTSISSAIAFGASLLDRNDIQGMRRVIDVSGDGPNNAGPPVEPARDAAVANGIIINGLAILIRPSAAVGQLDQYYKDCVIGGPGAFVLPVRKPEDFATAIRRKLIMEVSKAEDLIVPVQDTSPTICASGERFRPFFMDLDSR